MSKKSSTFAAAKVFNEKNAYQKIGPFNEAKHYINILYMKKIAVASLILFSLIIVGFGYKQGILSRISHPQPVHVSRALYHNPDSLAHYAELAYLHEDPQGLYVTGAAAFLRDSDPDFPDSCTTVSLDEAAILLLRAAELGHPDAQALIHCLNDAGYWHHSIPEDK